MVFIQFADNIGHVAMATIKNNNLITIKRFVDKDYII